MAISLGATTIASAVINDVLLIVLPAIVAVMAVEHVGKLRPVSTRGK